MHASYHRIESSTRPSIRLPIPQLEEPSPAGGTPALLPPGSAAGALDPAAAPGQGADDDADQHAERDPGVARRGAAEAEEDALDEARGGLGGDLGRAGDDLGEGFEDGGARGHDGRAGDGRVPVSAVLYGTVVR